MPWLIYPAGSYIDGLRVMAWELAGWAVREIEGTQEIWGPPSIAGSVNLDIVKMCGCIDADIP